MLDEPNNDVKSTRENYFEDYGKLVIKAGELDMNVASPVHKMTIDVKLVEVGKSQQIDDRVKQIRLENVIGALVVLLALFVVLFVLSNLNII